MIAASPLWHDPQEDHEDGPEDADLESLIGSLANSMEILLRITHRLDSKPVE